MRYFRRLLVLVCALTPPAGFSVPSTRDLLREDWRPAIGVTAQLAESDLRATAGDLSPSDWMQRTMRIYEEMIGALLPILVEKPVFFLARDMDDAFDAFQVFLAADPRGAALRARLHLLRVSREVARTASDRQLESWLRIEGMDTEAIRSGTSGAVVLDVGWRGQIPRRLRSLLGAGIEVRLLASSDGHFPELFDTPQSRGAAGIPPGREAGVDYVANNVRHPRRNWRGRGMRLTADGRDIASYETDSASDAAVDRAAVLRLQWNLARHFSSRALWDRFGACVDAAVRAIAPPPATPPIARLPAGTELTIAGVGPLRVERILHVGNKTVVHLAVTTTGTARRVTLKTALDETPDAIEAIAKEKSRSDEIALLGLAHPAILAVGRTYLVREWIDGLTGKEWLAHWAHHPDADVTAALRGWQAIIETSRARGAYVRNLRPSNLVWDGSHWHLVDPGPVKRGLADAEVIARYRENLSERWAPGIAGACAARLLELTNTGGNP